MKHGLTVFIVFVFAGVGAAQPVLSTSKSEALIGDKLSVTLKINTRANEDWLNPEVTPGDTVASIQVLDQTDVVLSDNGVLTKTWDVAIYDTGYVRIPPMLVMLGGQSGSRSYYSNDIPIYVQPIDAYDPEINQRNQRGRSKELA